MTPPLTKPDLRRAMRAKLRALSPAERASASHALCARLLDVLADGPTATIAGYAPIQWEPDLTPAYQTLVARGHRMLYPARLADRWCFLPASEAWDATPTLPAPQPMGNPREARTPEIVLVPGVGFARNGLRLGRGGGIYDRLLAPIRAWKIGIAHDIQLAEAWRGDAHDIGMDVILTPSETIAVSPR